MTSPERVPTASRPLKVLICIASMLGACGDTPNDGTDLGEPPEADTYCLIQIGITTTDDARDILGVETSAAHSQSLTMLTYRYGLAADARFAVIQFDEEDLFFGAVMMGVPFPECWTSELQREQRVVAAAFSKAAKANGTQGSAG